MIVDRASAIAYRPGDTKPLLDYRHSGTAEQIAISGRFAPRTDARVALRQPAGDACGDRGGSLDVQEVTEVRHDLKNTRDEQPTVLVGRQHDAAVVAAMELQQGCCNVRLGPAHAIDERRERAHDRAVVLERCGEAALETGVQLVTARGVEREARRPGAPQAIDQGELAPAHEIAGSWELEQDHIPALLPLLRGGERA